ncbi:glycosyltransferase family 2 protein [Pararhodobacter zhoushanensis]|uniref:Glycosyltransferase family 2 protein n=1 Tax=Pararhodobacter zhoushanensis TaxID=2479545 RepID=A0ABT3GUS6_9RHOB|nr:glycosyltransferase family 2 protein [Pararhodobacter zhoushanensis]MCW1931288.1 glycosyltransferase family 2 protein [Pararhodobacter zhoushanensis]
MGFLTSYRLRLMRKRWQLRARLKRRELAPLADRTHQLRKTSILLFATLRNEKSRLAYFLTYYRALGVEHFLIVDNGSDDGSAEYLSAQPDVSVWRTTASYKASRFGMDWMNALLRRYAHGRWALVVDVDEFFLYPFCDTRPLRALTDWLDDAGLRSFGTLLLDVYPKGPVNAQPCIEGQNPLEIASWFDNANYAITRNHQYRNLWIQGGPRARGFFADTPKAAPALNKIPLVKWDRSYAYVSSTHMLLPRGLNLTYDTYGGEKASGCLLHAKFLATLTSKAREEMARGEHYADSREYKAYAEGLEDGTDLWTKWSERFINWRQLEIMGLMSKGNWA